MHMSAQGSIGQLILEYMVCRFDLMLVIIVWPIGSKYVILSDFHLFY